MPRLSRFISGLRALLGQQRVEQELDDELRAYLEVSIEEKIRAGMTRSEAERAAKVEMGSLDATKDYVRDVGWETRIESAWRDVRYAARRLRKSPAFTAVAVTTLALGIGANTAIFSAVNAIMLRQLPVERPDELIALSTIYPNGIEPVFSYAAYRRIAAESAGLADPIAASTVRRDAVALDGPPEAVDLKWVSGNYFSTLGIRPALGRTLMASDDVPPPGERVAVISDAYWTRRFGRNADVIGRTLRLRGLPFAIVGVAPRGFLGESAGETVDLWLPLTSQPGAPSWLWTGHSTTWLRILARRRPDVSLDRARAGLEPIYGRIRDEIATGTDSAEFRRSVLDSRLAVTEASRGSSNVRDNLSAPLLVLMAIVGLVLLVACANVASLMLARAAATRRETAVCLAMGAGRFRLVRQGLSEALLIAALGGIGGILLASWGTSVLATLISGVLPVSLDISPDTRVLAFAALASCATALFFGFLPTLRATRIDPLDALKGAGGTGRTIARIPIGRTLVVTQIAVSLVLLVTAALFVRSLVKLKEIDPGFDPDRLVVLKLTPPISAAPLTPETRRAIYQQLLLRAQEIPGVERASTSFSGMLSSEMWRNVVAVEGYTPPDGLTPRTLANSVSSEYFNVQRIAVLRGRGFTTEDRENTAKVAVVNDAFARQFFGGTEPVGRRVALCTSDPCGAPAQGMMNVVGVVEDAKYAALREAPRPMLYVSSAQFDRPVREIQVRTAGDPSAAAATIYRQLANADTRIAVVGMFLARERVSDSIVAETLTAKLSAVFGLLALALAGVGLYGLIAYVTAQRTSEIGIRIALGAERRDVRRLVLRDTVTLVALGAALGVPAALAGAQLLSSLLYQVRPLDPLAITVSLGALACLALFAGYVPARRATAVDPVSALRAE